MMRTNCYWYHEYRDMNMTVPYCEELKINNPHCEGECSCKYYISKDDADKVIRNATESLSADSVEVVRCGDCKFLMPSGLCTVFADECIRPSVSDFCSHGQRRKK